MHRRDRAPVCGKIRHKCAAVAELQTGRNEAVITELLLSQLWDRESDFIPLSVTQGEEKG